MGLGLLHQSSEAGKRVQDLQSMPPDHSRRPACLPKGYTGQSVYSKQPCSQPQDAPTYYYPPPKHWSGTAFPNLCTRVSNTNCSCCFVFISKPEFNQPATEEAPESRGSMRSRVGITGRASSQQMPSRMFRLRQGKKCFCQYNPDMLVISPSRSHSEIA